MQYEPNWEGEKEAHRQVRRDRARLDLQAAYPAILADLRERLLGDEAVEVVAKRLGKDHEAWLYTPWSAIPAKGRDQLRDEACGHLEAALSEVMG